MILGLDVWAGSLDIDERVLLDNDLKYIITRINSITGGLNLDVNFKNQWDQSYQFLRAPYFVYSPWYDGETNAEWLFDNLPDTGVTRVFLDIEVKRDGYLPTTYADQVDKFVDIVAAKYSPCIYTGAWFLSYLAYWPKDVDYWWARYPYYLYPSVDTYITWSAFRTRLNYVGWSPDPYKTCPGTLKLWQCTADRYILPGTAGRVIDVNAWNGTIDELEKWWGQTAPLSLEQRIAILEREARLHSWNLSL